jgi:hypothetical protein
MRKVCLNITILIIISIATPVWVPPAHGADFQTWSDIATIYRFGKGWRYDGDYGIRGVLSDSDFTLMYIRPSFRYRVKPWFTVHGGIRFFKTWFDDYDDTFEIGPWQGLRFTWPVIGRYAISHYFRLEERMIWETGGDRDFDFNLRGRYQLGFRTPNYEILFKNGVYLTGSLEAFWDLEESARDSIVDRIRYDLGVGTRISDAWRIQLHGILQDGRAIDSVFQDLGETDERILRLRLFYTFN